MEVFARLKGAPLSAQKARLVANSIRGLSVGRALNRLNFGRTKAAQVVKKVLNSAVANAENNAGADIDVLRVSTIMVDEGSTLKRIRARAKGRANRILKRTCHITVAVKEEE